MVMRTEVDTIRRYFAKLGLASEIADLYLALHTHGPQTISELSRNSGVERTRIYRLIDKLMASNLIEVETQHKRGIIKAAPIANITILISQREQELKSLQDELELIEQVLGRNALSSPATRIQFYRGQSGLRQMFWNETKSAATEHVSILYTLVQSHAGQAFFNRWAEASNQKGIHSKSIIGDHFMSSLRDWRKDNPDADRLRHWQGRYVSNEVFTIRHDTVIYDNVTSYYNWKDGEIFGIEIYNQEIADSQRQLFNLLWQQAKDMPKL